jgi:ribosomal protein S18 acetylase RimI-like enzyme
VPIEIVEATPADLGVLCELERDVPGSEADPDLLPDAMRAGGVIIARSDGAIAGFVLFAPWFFGRMLVARVSVARDHRRKGIASLLLQHVMKRAGSAGLFISTNRSNTGAQRLYEKLGFERSGEIDNIDAGDPELIYFAKAGNSTG